jgi:hypothetical protein
MIQKRIFPIVIGAVLAGGTTALAAGYRPEDFLKLDLSTAVLSPVPLGPAAHFEPLPVEAKVETKPDPTPGQKAARAAAATSSHARPESPHKLAIPHVHVARPIERPHGAARTRLAHRPGNPLDAQALDTRIQTWPCRPGMGGICNWK